MRIYALSEKDGYVAVGAVAIFKSISGILFGNDMAAADACFCKALVSTTDKIQISEIITPIVKRYSLPAVYLFVSYAGELPMIRVISTCW